MKHSLADLTHAKQVLGYEPIVDFPTGLRATMDWYRGRRRRRRSNRPRALAPAQQPPRRSRRRRCW